MARPVSSEILVFLLAVLLVFPVSAVIADEASPDPAAPATTVPYSITLFIPSATMVHSTQLMDLVNIPNSSGAVVLATSFGLSTYNGTWSTRHKTLDNVSEGLMDDYITAVEYDRNGSLWIGYSGGIQIYNGRYYQTLRDQQLFKDLQIRDLQRWNDDMWVAAGNAGIHRYRYGIWTWFQPFSKNGPGFYEADSMTIDPVSNSLLIATKNEGLWIVRSQEDPVIFESISARDSHYGMLNHVRKDPDGGVFFFNDSMVVHYSPGDNFTPVLTNRDLSITLPEINDLAADPHGKLYLATDRGIDIWENRRIYRHLDRFEGIGTSSVVSTMNVDSQNRVWFSTQDEIGYYLDRSGQSGEVPLLTMTTQPALVGTYSGGFHSAIPTFREDSMPVLPSNVSQPEEEGINAIIGPLIRAIREALSGFGL